MQLLADEAMPTMTPESKVHAHPVVEVAHAVPDQRRHEQRLAGEEHALPTTESAHEIAQLLAVPSSRVERVVAFFEHAGARVVVHPHKDSLNIQMSVWALEAALQTQLYWFAHSTVAAAPQLWL